MVGIAGVSRRVGQIETSGANIIRAAAKKTVMTQLASEAHEEPANGPSRQEVEFPVASPPVDAEVAVEREHSGFLVDFGASDETRIGE